MPHICSFVNGVVAEMGRSHLSKLLRRKFGEVDAKPPVKRSAIVTTDSAHGGGIAGKRRKNLPGLLHRPHDNHGEAFIDLDEVLAGHATAYASLVGTLSNSSMAMRLRNMQQEGGSDDEDEKEEVWTTGMDYATMEISS